jgi:hypothetical protein
MSARRQFDVECVVEIEQTHDSFHAHAIPRGVTIRPGDSVQIHGAPTAIPFGACMTINCRATVTRANWATRLWTQMVGLLELTDLYEVGFSPKETP